MSGSMSFDNVFDSFDSYDSYDSEWTEPITIDDFMIPSSSPLGSSDSEFSPFCDDDLGGSSLQEEELLSFIQEEKAFEKGIPVPSLSPKQSGVFNDITLNDEDLDLDQKQKNMFGQFAPAIETQADYTEPSFDFRAGFSSTMSGFTSTSVGVPPTPSNVSSEPNLGSNLPVPLPTLKTTASYLISAGWTPATHLYTLGQVIPVGATGTILSVPTPTIAHTRQERAPVAVTLPVPSQATPCTFASTAPTSHKRRPVSSSDDDSDEEYIPEEIMHQEIVYQPVSAAEDYEADDSSFPGECKQCAQLFKCLQKEPKSKLGKLSPADQHLTNDMFQKYLDQCDRMSTTDKASHIDLYFKLRDIKALRKMVGIHNKYHQTDTKPKNVESTTRLLGQKYTLTRVCVEDISIPFRKFLKAKKAAGRSKPSRSARQHKDTQSKIKATRGSPY